MNLKMIILGIIVIIIINGCNFSDLDISRRKLLESQAELNARLIDSINIDKLNKCTELGSCDGWKCLCDTMVSKNDYCQRYEDFCINNICDEIIKNVDGVNFIEEHWGNDKYSGCIFVYDKVVLIDNIEIENISDGRLNCLADYRNNLDVPDWHIYSYYYHNEIFFNDVGERIEC